MDDPKDIRADVRNEIIFNDKIARGNAVWERFPSLTRILLGFRPAELTILTGSTGIGKTTFISEYAVDLWNQSVSTMFCSFETSYVRVYKMMLCQFARKPLWKKENHKDIDKYLDRFTRNNLMLFLRNEYFDGQNPQAIIQAIRQQVSASDAKHVVIDSLQAMLALQELKKGSAKSRTVTEDYCISEFRRLATESKAHITVVMHPRKETENSGSSRAMQEADNVLVMKRSERSGKKYLQVSKNRFGGEKVGEERIEMTYQKDTLCHALVDRRTRASD